MLDQFNFWSKLIIGFRFKRFLHAKQVPLFLNIIGTFFFPPGKDFREDNPGKGREESIFYETCSQQTITASTPLHGGQGSCSHDSKDGLAFPHCAFVWNVFSALESQQAEKWETKKLGFVSYWRQKHFHSMSQRNQKNSGRHRSRPLHFLCGRPNHRMPQGLHFYKFLQNLVTFPFGSGSPQELCNTAWSKKN